MTPRNPVDRAVATYRSDWALTKANNPEALSVNSETLDSSTPSDFSFRYIDISSVQDGVIDWGATQSLRFADAPSRARRVVRPGDTLLSTVRPLLGAHTLADWSEDIPTVCSTGFAVLRCSAAFDPEFIRHLPFAQAVRRQLMAWQCGTNYPAVNERDVARLTLPLPSRDEQSAIARMLNSIDNAATCARDAMGRARELRRAILQRFFYSAIGETAYANRPKQSLPPGWSLEPAGSLLSGDPKNGISPEARSQPPGTPTFSIAAIRDGRVDLTESNHLKYVDLPEVVTEKYRLRKGDVLIVRGNANPDLVGKAAIVDTFPNGCVYPDITKRVAFAVPSEPGVLPEFAVIAWNHPVVHNQVLRRAKTSSGTLKINNKDVKEIVLPVPPLAAQRELVRVVETIRREERALLDISIRYALAKRALMDSLLSGELRIERQGATS